MSWATRGWNRTLETDRNWTHYKMTLLSFAFGENDIYEQLANEKGTRVYDLQKRFQAIFGFTLPLFHGRGVFNYHFGFLPYRHPIVSVGE